MAKYTAQLKNGDRVTYEAKSVFDAMAFLDEDGDGNDVEYWVSESTAIHYHNSTPTILVAK